MWAKRGVLAGSFLGATLVTALLAIVPLYESSIAAIDLLFTFRQAPTVSVDLLATRNTTNYQTAEALAASNSVDQQQAEIALWYPESTQRILTREFRFIPPENPDWLGAAEQWRGAIVEWRAEIAAIIGEPNPEALGDPQLLAEIVDDSPEDLGEEAAAALAALEEVPPFPAPPYPQPPQEATQSRLITSSGIRDAIEIIDGEWPGDEPVPVAGDDPRLRVVLGEDLAIRTGLGVGDDSILRPFIGQPFTFEMIEVAAIARPVDPAAPLWLATSPSDLMFIPFSTLSAWSVPIPIDKESDPWLRDVRGFPALNATQSWYFPLDRPAVQLENVEQLRGSVQNFSAELGRVSGISVSTALPGLIESFDVRTTVFGGPILAMLALVVAGALYFLIYTAGLTLEREGPELALLRARGASRWQTVGIHLMQAAIIAAVAAVLAPFVARFMVAVTGRIPPMSELTGGETLRVAESRSVLPFVLAGAALTFVTMGLAVIPFARRSVLELRSLAARPTRVSIWQRYYLDVFLVVLAGILLFELRQRGLVDTGEEPGLDPFSVASPALFLFAGALVLLRILPFILRAVGWLMTRLGGMGTALPGWHLGRNPVPYGRLALLIWLTTGFGAFALTYAATLEGSYDDRAAYAAGSDLRIVADGVGFLDAPEDADSAAVLRGIGGPRLATRGAELLAVRPDFGSVVSWRADFGEPTAEATLAPLRPGGIAPDWGVELPDDASALVVDAIRLSGADDPEFPLQLVIRIADGKARLWTFASDPIPDERWGAIRIDLIGAAAINAGPAEIPRPMAIQAMWVERRITGTGQVVVSERVVFDDFRVATDSGEQILDEAIASEFVGVQGMLATEDSGAIAARVLEDDSLTRPGEVMVWTTPVVGRVGAVPFLSRPLEPIKVLLDPEAASTAAIDLGDEASYSINSQSIPGVRVGSINLVPTTGDSTTTGLMVVDLDGLLQWLNATPNWSLQGVLSALAEPGELWVATDDADGAAQTIAGQLDQVPDLVVTAQGVATQFSGRPVQVGLVSILFVGAATGVVLAMAGVIGYVLIAVRRRAREMGVLRALGFGRRGVAATFALEQLVVLGLGAVIGVIAGVGLMRLLIPFLQLGEAAEELVPEVLIKLNPPVLFGYLGTVALLLVVAVLWSTRSVSARRLSEVLREVDR